MKSGNKKPKPKGKKTRSAWRRRARVAAVAALLAFVAFCWFGSWYVHHPADWLEERRKSLPGFAWRAIEGVGDPVAMATDAFGWTGHDAVYELDVPPPQGRVFFAGPPVRIGPPAPADVKVMVKGEFAVGYSPSLGHGVWAAYHVPPEAKFPSAKRPGFRKDRDAPGCPAAGAYARSGYDRGHLAPNYAIATRFGAEEQAKTFLMSNIGPQRPALNRGSWRELEMTIADLWTARYGELWVIVGNVSPADRSRRTTLPAAEVDVPTHWWMLVVAQNGGDVRALAMLIPQDEPYGAYPVHRIVTVDELEEFTGWNLLAELPEYVQRPLEADRPTRLWPLNFLDAAKLVKLRLSR